MAQAERVRLMLNPINQRLPEEFVVETLGAEIRNDVLAVFFLNNPDATVVSRKLKDGPAGDFGTVYMIVETETAAKQTIQDFNGTKSDSLSSQSWIAMLKHIWRKYDGPAIKLDECGNDSRLDRLASNQIVWIRGRGLLRYKDPFKSEIEEAVFGRRL